VAAFVDSSSKSFASVEITHPATAVFVDPGGYGSHVEGEILVQRHAAAETALPGLSSSGSGRVLVRAAGAPAALPGLLGRGQAKAPATARGATELGGLQASGSAHVVASVSTTTNLPALRTTGVARSLELPPAVDFAGRVDFDAIGSLARALLAQLSPLTGTRATATLRIVNDSGGIVVVPANTYLVPVVGNERADELAFKTTRDPITARAHGQGGNWTVLQGNRVRVRVQSNLGGVRHNLPAGTRMLFDPPIEGLTATLFNDASGGTDSSLLRRATYYEELDGARIERDLQNARVHSLPGVVLIWAGSAPAEGRTVGLEQGSTRASFEQRVMRETFELFVVAGNMGGDSSRRSDGLVTLQAVTRMLTDQVSNLDGELLAVVGSLEILGRERFERGQRTYVYRMQVRCSRLDTLLPNVDPGDYPQWAVAHVDVALPGREDPEPTAPLTTASEDVEIN
jgi:hypothetical protein